MEALFDSHAHYYDAKFSTLAGGADALLREGFTSGDIARIINVGTNNENSVTAVRMAAMYPGMYAAVGIHPEDCQSYTDTDMEISRLRTFLGTEETRCRDKIVAIGEIGMDNHCEFCNRDKQLVYFEAQMSLAGELGLPVIIHDREAHGDCFETVLRHPEVTGVFHSYSGSAEMAHELTRRGWYISFSGVVTFKNASRVREVAATVPADRLLIETDCPYLAPHPHRGEINHSGYLRFTAASLAEVRGTTADEVIRLTRENAKRLFGLE